MFPLLALPYMAAGIGTLGAGARAAGSPQGQRFIQGGINTLNRVGTRLKDFLNPITQIGPQLQVQGQPVKSFVGKQTASLPFYDVGLDASQSIVDAINKLIEEDEDEDKKDKKKKKTKKDEIPEVPMMKKGGMAKSKKPKKKRKKYKSGTFVKMKGSKRYI